jgi:hypothetical protein
MIADVLCDRWRNRPDAVRRSHIRPYMFVLAAVADLGAPFFARENEPSPIASSQWMPLSRSSWPAQPALCALCLNKRQPRICY